MREPFTANKQKPEPGRNRAGSIKPRMKPPRCPLKTRGRLHNYLRVSVTDRCNLRCRYCMGPEGVKNIPHEQILSYEEILQVIRAGARLGISRVRLTGGEPLVRKNVVSLVEQTAQVPGIEDLSMTTNGLLLKKYAPDLKKAGLMRGISASIPNGGLLLHPGAATWQGGRPGAALSWGWSGKSTPCS